MTDYVLFPLLASSSPSVKPRPDINISGKEDPGWKVTVFNNETNTYEEVIAILMIATGCDAEEAYIETWEIDHYGSCVVHRSDQEACQQAAQIIAKIGIKAEAEPDEGL